MLQARRRRDFPWVAWRPAEGSPVRISDFRRVWEKACVKAGLGRFEPVLDDEGKPVITKRSDRPNGKGKPQLRYVGLILHDLRRSAVRNLVEAGVQEKDVMLISGHKTRSVFDRYNIRSSRDIARVGERLTAYYEKFGHNLGTIEASEAPNKESIN